MCGGVIYKYAGKRVKAYFPNPEARLPVKMKLAEPGLMTWGRRKEQPGALPLGGWARLESIKDGRWQKWQPIPVKIPVSEFMEKDNQGESHWFELKEREWIQGLVARNEAEMRVYVVTVSPPMADAIHDRWPRVLSE